MSDAALTLPSKSHLSFEEMELAVLDELCERFRHGGESSMYADMLETEFGVDKERSNSLFTRLVAIGAIERYPTSDLFGTVGTRYAYRIDGRICEIAASQRTIRNAPVDRVDSVTRWARSHRYIAWLFIGAIALTTLVTLLNQSLELIERLRGHDAPPAAPTDEAK